MGTLLSFPFYKFKNVLKNSLLLKAEEYNLVEVLCVFVFKRNLSILVSDGTDLLEEEWLRVQKEVWTVSWADEKYTSDRGISREEGSTFLPS